MTYMGTNGRQYVVVAAGGSNRFGMIAGTAGHNADALIAFALSNKQRNASSISSPQPTATPVAPPIPAAQPPAGPSGATGPFAVKGPPQTAAEASASLPNGDGKAVVLATCTKCHGTGNFTSIRMSREGWKDEVNSMRAKGAVGTDDDFKKVIEYLTRTFPRQ